MSAVLISQLELTALALIAVVLHAFRRPLAWHLVLLLGMFFIVAWWQILQNLSRCFIRMVCSAVWAPG